MRSRSSVGQVLCFSHAERIVATSPPKPVIVPIYGTTANPGEWLVYKALQDLVAQSIPVVFLASREHFSFYSSLFAKRGVNLSEKVQSGKLAFVDAFSSLYEGIPTGMLPLSETVPPTFSLHVPSKVRRLALVATPGEKSSAENCGRILGVIESAMGVGKEGMYIVVEDMAQLLLQAGINEVHALELIDSLKLLTVYHPNKPSLLMSLNVDLLETEKIRTNLMGLEDLHIEIRENVSGYSRDVSGMLQIVAKPSAESQFFRFKLSESDAELIEYKMV